ncbi:MAG TPA: cytochrome P450 [Caulobacteraceae bacterium]|nr:cytochrome P450 [Caulobacteraceae bacterium]
MDLDDLPRLPDPRAFAGDPLNTLRSLRRRGLDRVIIAEGRPLFSRQEACPGVVGVFGEDLVRTALTSDAFGMPPSAARTLSLPPELLNLNRSLHSMTAAEHAAQRRMLASAMRASPADLKRTVDREAARLATEDDAQPSPLLATLRRLTSRVAARIVLGPGPEALAAAEAALQYFDLRRSAAPSPEAKPDPQDTLVRAGLLADRRLRRLVTSAAERPAGDGSLLASLVRDPADGLTEDQLVAHANILLISGAEPVATVLASVFVVLHHRPALARQLGQWALGDEPSDDLERLVLEVLRLLPPNAFMTRVALRDTAIGDCTLPRGAELLLCPFVSHREAPPFDEPDMFLPDRWRSVAPTAFQFMPFGAGAHACIGRSWAMTLVLEGLLGVFRHLPHIALDEEDPIDWRVDITLRPDRELMFTTRPRDRRGARHNLIANMVDFPASP